MPKLYSSYIASSFILPFLVSTVFFVSFLMTFELFRIMTLISADNISLFFIMRMMGNIMTTLIPMAIPISIFFSTIYCLSQMSGDAEYVAMRAAGLSKNKILIPFIVISSLVAISVYFLSQELVPDAHVKVRKKIKIVSSSSLIQGLKSGQFFTKLPNITIFPTEFDEKTKNLKQVFLHMYDDNNKLDKIIVARTGKIIHKKDETTGIEIFKLNLKNGNIVNIRSRNLDTEKILFDEYILPISEKRFSYKTSMKEIMMNKEELNKFIGDGLEKAKAKGFKAKDYFNARYEYWNRINTPILVLIFTFLGFGLGITGSRGKSRNSSGKAILYLVGYYVLYFAMVSQARDDNIPVILVAVIPNIVLLVFAIRAYRRVDWLS